LLEILGRCRRRLLLVSLLRNLAVGLAVVLTLLAVAALVWPTSFQVFDRRTAIVLGLVGGLATLLAWTRRPSIGQAAGELDRRLSLDDSFVAALDCQRTGAPVAPLVVRYAVRRFGSADPRTVVPFNTAVPSALLLTSLAVAFAIGTWRPAPDPVRLSGREAAVSDGAAFESGRAARSASPSEERVVDEAVRAARTTLPNDRPSDLPRQEPGGSGASVADAPSAPHSPQRPDLADEPAGSGGRSSQMPSGLGRQNRSASVGGAGASSLGTRSETGSRSGGVREGSLLGDAPSTMDASGDGRSSPAATRNAPAGSARTAGWVNEHVPPALREYVRAYFLAVGRRPERP
jgi:hypothetical protein